MTLNLVARVPGWAIDPGLYEVLLLVGGAMLLIGSVVLSVQRGRPFTASIIYLTAGVMAGLVLRAVGIHWYDPVADAVMFSRAAEFAVIVSLFGAGLKLDRALTWTGWRTTVLLLAVAMPLTIAGVALVGMWLLALSLPAAVLLGAILAPTDPVLAGDVQVGGPLEEAPEDDARFSLTAEAGLNDGLAFPFVILALFGLERGFDAAGEWIMEWVTADLLYAVVAGIAIGAVAGRALAALAYRAVARGWLAAPFQGFVALGAVFGVYAAAELVEAYGFLAVFAAGVAFRRYEHQHEMNRRLHEFTMSVEKIAEIGVLLLLGSVLPIAGVPELGWGAIGAAAALVLLIRPLCAGIALVRSRLSLREHLFVAWFGVRGIGSIYYLGFAFTMLSPVDARPIFTVTALAILLSVMLHGLTAGPLARRLER